MKHLTNEETIFHLLCREASNNVKTHWKKLWVVGNHEEVWTTDIEYVCDCRSPEIAELIVKMHNEEI